MLGGGAGSLLDMIIKMKNNAALVKEPRRYRFDKDSIRKREGAKPSTRKALKLYFKEKTEKEQLEKARMRTIVFTLVLILSILAVYTFFFTK